MARPKPSLIDSVKQFCLRNGFNRTYWIAYSGGLDSHVLLHVFANLRTSFPLLKLRAIYINHQLSPQASHWGLHCEKISSELQVEFVQQCINAKSNQGDSPENVAREKRYTVFAELMTENDFIVTAHHQDDQAETVLLQLLRGAGLKGLSGMPEMKAFASGYLARPLLKFTRDELQQYAEQQQLIWIEDESNTNSSFTRNFLRHDIFPLLKKRWPQVSNTFSRVAEHCAKAQQIVDEVAKIDLTLVLGSKPGALSVKKLLALDVEKQRYIVREWLSAQEFPVPSTIKMQHIIQDMLYARSDKMPCVAWGGIEMRRYRDDLYVMPALVDHDATQIIDWDVRQPLVLQGIGILHPELFKNYSGDLKNVTVRFRQGGERYKHHALKNKFQEWGVPPWMRERIPLVFVGDELVLVFSTLRNPYFAEWI